MRTIPRNKKITNNYNKLETETFQNHERLRETFLAIVPKLYL